MATAVVDESQLTTEVPKSEDSWVAIHNETNSESNVDAVIIEPTVSQTTESQQTTQPKNGKKKVRRHRKRKKKSDGTATSTSNDVNNVNVNKASNQTNVNSNTHTSVGNSPQKQKQTKNNITNAKSSSIGATVALKIPKKRKQIGSIHPSMTNSNANSSINNRSDKSDNGFNLDDIMRQENIKNKQKQKNKTISNNHNINNVDIIDNSNNIENLLTEEELIQAILLESMNDGNVNITNKNENNNNDNNNEKIVENNENSDKIDKIDQIETQNPKNTKKDVKDTKDTNTQNKEKLANVKEELKINDIDSDYLIAMSLQESEESQYFQQKELQEREAGSKYAKVQSKDNLSENSLNFYFNHKKNIIKNGENSHVVTDSGNNDDNGSNSNKGSSADGKSKENLEQIDPKLFEWTGGHIESSGTVAKHDKRTWSKKHIQRLNDYEGIGTEINNSVTMGNQAYNSFCRAIERKGFKKEYM